MTINNNIYNTMKKKVLIAACALLMSMGHAWADELTIGNVTVPQGGTADLTVNYSFTSTTDKVGFTFSAALPEGISFVKDEDGDPVYQKDATSIDKLNIVCAGEGNFAGQPANATATIKGTAGTLLTLTLKADAALAVGSSYDVNVTKVTFQERVDGSVKDINLDDFTFKVTIGEPVDPRVVLDETATTQPAAATGVDVRVKRTINAGEWSTICLPFAMTAEQVKAAFGNDVQLADFSSWNSEEDGEGAIVTINVGFTDVTEMEANHPYIIKVSAKVTEFIVDGVDIDPEEEPVVQVGKRTSERGYMYGTYVKTTIPEENVFLSGNKFWYSTGKTQTKGLRGYFEFRDVLDAYYDETSAASRIVMFFEDETTTGVTEIVNSKLSNSKYYDLQGRRVVKPVKGLYIKNGRKEVIK